MTAKLLLTETEAAQALSLCPRTLRKARKDGRLQFVLIGRAVRYTMSDLSQFVETHAMIETAANKPTPRPIAKKQTAGNIVPFSQRQR